ncbi:MAG TPA: DUF459 domain-containing protein [Pelagibacterium sp.]|uniref:SGNH/GDSL hydrolase family protein n=1 Tax=Pelagibacterium sp. TaxID=1967288 RepID=UPI002C4F33AC|nr:DUF459 domain-containing protein [Pelagibacterium sp.]HWJ86872.1 DUF459 domain-containing protein [Pelagibacterium sp.]
MTGLRAPLGSLLVIVLALAVAWSAPALAQQRSLFDVLFGGNNNAATQPPPPAAQPRTQPQPQSIRRAPAPAPAPAPVAPPAQTIAKSDVAQRVAVFGDSLGVDLARALDRLYAENPDIAVLQKSVGSSGFVRNDFYNWNTAIEDELVADSFDVAVVAIGVNDRQVLNGAEPLSDPWREAYRARLDAFLGNIRAAGKQVIWIELPPMEQPTYGAAMAQISSIHKAAISAVGGEWVETYDRYLGENGAYSASGPDLNGNIVVMRKGDGIHFSAAGADKLAFYVDRAMGAGGSRVSLSGSTLEVADLLAGTDAATMLRPPFQGLEQMRLVEMASLVQDLGGVAPRAGDLILAGTPVARGFALEDMLDAPAGRVDAFGVGRVRRVVENPTGR